MVKLKVGRNIIDIDEGDLILDNGACYQIITRKVGDALKSTCPIMSKKLFNEFKKTGLIFTNDMLKKLAANKYGDSIYVYWKFNIDRMEEMGY